MQKKYIYYGIIVLCIGVMVWAFMTMNSGSVPESNLAPIANSGEDAPAASAASASAKKQDYLTKEYPSPKVFPENNRYNSMILDDPEVKALTDYESVTVPDELKGKDNLFAPFQQAE